MKKFFYKLLFVAFLLVANSCNLDNFDFNKLSEDVNLSPEFIIPIASADISVWDVIESVNDENDTLLKTGENGILKIVYTKEEIYNYQVRDLVDFPQTKSFSSGNKVFGGISIADVQVNKRVNLWDVTNAVDGPIDNIIPMDGTINVFPSTSFVGPPPAVYAVPDVADFSWVKFTKGSVEVTFKNNLPVPVSIQGGLIDRQGSGFAALNFTNVNPGEVKTTTSSMVGFTISNQIDFRMTRFETFSTGMPAPINLNDDFELTVKFKDIEIWEGNVSVKQQEITGFSGVFDFEIDDGVKAFEANIEKGYLDVAMVNNSGLNGTVNLTFPTIKKNGTSIPLSIAVPTNSHFNTINLNDYTVNLASDATTPYNKIPYEYSIAVNASSGNVNYYSTDYIRMDVSLSSLDFKSIKGDFGEKNVAISQGSFNIGTDFFDKISGDFKLANPQIRLLFSNKIGIPAEVNAQLTGSNNDGHSETLVPSPFRLETPASLGAPAVMQTITFNKGNSNIVDFIALPPSGDITYSGNIHFNPDGPVTAANANFFDLDDFMKIDLGIDLPFELQVNNLMFQDTTEINGEDLDMIKSAELIINAVNEIPLDIDVQLFFVDTISGTQFGSSTKSKLLTAAQVGTGGTITPVTSTNSISLSESEFDNLKKANGIVFKGFLSSPEDGTKEAAIYGSSRLNMNVVIKAKIDL